MTKSDRIFLTHLNKRIKSLSNLTRVAKTLELKFINKGRLEEAKILKEVFKDSLR